MQYMYFVGIYKNKIVRTRFRTRY